MRTEKKVAIIVAVMMVILGSVMAASAFRTAEAEMKTSYKDEDYQEKKIEIAESFDDIEIKLLDRDLEILRSSDNKAYFECREGKRAKFEAYVSGGTLKVEEELESKVFNIDGLFVDGINFDTKLYLPKDSYNNLTVSLGSGDINSKENFSFRDIDVVVGSGDVYLSNLASEEVKGKTGSGQVWFYDSKAKRVQIKSGSGDIAVENLACERTFEAEVSSGDVTLTEVTASQSFDVSTGSGDITLRSCDSMNINMKSGSGKIRGSVKTAKSFDAKSGSGDVNVPESGNGGNCVIRTGSGDIDITVEN